MNNLIVEYNLKHLSIIVKSNKYTRTIICKDLDSYLEETRRLYVDLKNYFETFKECE